MKKNEFGFSSKELLIALGSIAVLCLLAWPAFFKLKKWQETKSVNETINATTSTTGQAESSRSE